MRDFISKTRVEKVCKERCLMLLWPFAHSQHIYKYITHVTHTRIGHIHIRYTCVSQTHYTHAHGSHMSHTCTTHINVTHIHTHCTLHTCMLQTCTDVLHRLTHMHKIESQERKERADLVHFGLGAWE